MSPETNGFLTTPQIGCSIHHVWKEWEWRVSELIDWRAKVWDRELIEATFHREDADAILCILLSNRLTLDVMIWLRSKDGEYTMRSGYQMARRIVKQEKDLGKSSKAAEGGQVWATIWKMEVPNKIRVFEWRACQDILPTRQNLFRRKVVNEDCCEQCKKAPESVLHVLWECGVAQDVWVGCSGRLQKRSTK